MSKEITRSFGYGYGEFTVTIVPGKSITVQRKDSDPITFNVGDICEESSYNLVYTGTIKQITEKNVIVTKEYRNRTTRMKIENFAWRNWDFDADRIAQQNFDTMQYI